MIIKTRAGKRAINTQLIETVSEPYADRVYDISVDAHVWTMSYTVSGGMFWLIFDTEGEAREAWEKLATAIA